MKFSYRKRKNTSRRHRKGSKKHNKKHHKKGSRKGSCKGKKHSRRGRKGSRKGRRFGSYGPGFAPPVGSMPNAEGAMYYGNPVPFGVPSEWYFPVSNGVYQFPQKLVDYSKN